MTVIRRAELVVTPWKNGLGRKADVASTDDWFVGLAWIEARAAFSDFTGMDRTIVLVEGEGFVLTVDGVPHVLRGPGAAHTFPGELPVVAEPLVGACAVFNVMTRRGEWSHRVDVGSDLPEQGFALVLAGMVDADPAPAGPGDILVLPHPGRRSDDVRAVIATLNRQGQVGPRGSNPEPTD